MTDPADRPGTVHRVQKARKAQICAECVVPIDVGQPYMYLNTFDELSRRWSRYILCRSCERWRSCHRITELSLKRELPYSSGKLREAVLSFAERIAGYKQAYRDAWAWHAAGNHVERADSSFPSPPAAADPSLPPTKDPT